MGADILRRGRPRRGVEAGSDEVRRVPPVGGEGRPKHDIYAAGVHLDGGGRARADAWSAIRLYVEHEALHFTVVIDICFCYDIRPLLNDLNGSIPPATPTVFLSVLLTDFLSRSTSAQSFRNRENLSFLPKKGRVPVS